MFFLSFLFDAFLPFSQAGDAHETLYFHKPNILFQFSIKKKTTKFDQNSSGNYFQTKTSKMTPEGTNNRRESLQNRCGEAQKSPKWANKNSFWRGRFFDDFLGGKKRSQEVTTIIDLSILLPLGSTGGL